MWWNIVPDWHNLSSTDMKNWTDHGAILKSTDVSWINTNECWAGHCVEKDGTFYWYICDSSEVGVVTSNNILGPYMDPVGAPIVPLKYAGIDPHCFIDDDGQAYLFWVGDGACRYVKLNDDMISFAFDVMEVSCISGAGYNFLEAPFVIKENGTYFIMFATQPWTSEIHYATAPTINGPWTYQARIGAATGNGTNHPGAAYFKGQWWFTYHTEELSGGNTSSRCVCVDTKKTIMLRLEPISKLKESMHQTVWQENVKDVVKSVLTNGNDSCSSGRCI